MGYDVRLVDNWGEKTELDTNFGFMGKVCEASPTWNGLMASCGIVANDGKHIPLHRIAAKVDGLLEDAKKQGDKDVSDYLISVVELVRKNTDEHGEQGNFALAFH